MSLGKEFVPIPLELQPEIVEIELEYIKQGYRTWRRSVGRCVVILIQRWEMLVDEIGSFDGSAYFYQNRIQTRKYLHEIEMLANRREAFDVLEWLLPIVESLDEKFRAKTSPDVDRLFWMATGDPAYWWERRLPDDEQLMIGFRAANEPELAARWAEVLELRLEHESENS